ncbi:MAG: flavin reductase family protein [Flavobacteriales bacterium]
MISFSPQDKTPLAVQAYLQAAIGPRPICFASTINARGEVNLSPFSFFNIFGTNPVTLIFSPARRVRDNTIKHTLENVREVDEVVINVVNFAMVQQTSLSSTEYARGVDEFLKSGFTKVASETIKPPRVKESPVQLECKVKQILETGDGGGAGNLVICEVQKIHVSEDILNEAGMIDQHKIDLVGRLGANWYVRASGDALFEVTKPLTTLGIGVDALPEPIRNSSVLTGNSLGRLGNVEKLPDANELNDFEASGRLAELAAEFGLTQGEMMVQAHQLAQQLLNSERVEEAWLLLLLSLKNNA